LASYLIQAELPIKVTPLLILVECIFQTFARAEFRLLGWLDFQRFAGARIATGARSALADVESTKANQANGIASFQRFFDGFDGCIQSAACGSLGNVGRSGDLINQFGLVPTSPLINEFKKQNFVRTDL